MKKLVKIFLLVGVFAVGAFAYNSDDTYLDPQLCSLKNLMNPGSCNPNRFWNKEYGCHALPHIRVKGEPVCVD
ncbi:hypothetical protein [Campylobacter helveticus]|uniref:hypothetical protein n=1 Tax=Campylobacter helveticus TaxID=28898 RepID=UPI0010470A23|nr:hypothetical protein [Campylobacter helveticus]QBL11180.1 hypothetical protein A0073_01130 [Campylobacter helveticus]TNB63166.1 hypothetical protein FDW43_05180 [Campylobacter helveticus]TNH35127.1 hypothetical protein FDW46_02305 [Campylobacter helveticus]TNH37141.1 hypothetical protein FDW45_01655 [Campylobacter helveticus]